MKKSILFSSLAILIAGFVIVTNKVNAENYSEESQQAYDFAYKNGITTTNSIEKAQMNSPLTRIAMAKMLSQFAMNVLGKTPNNSIVPTFSDVSKDLNEEYGGAVDLAYQLGIMGINMKNNEFRPHASVTRAEFGTALSRMLYGLEDGNPYYTTHLKKLKEEGIITNDNPSIKEKRGYVMLMLMRSQNNKLNSNEGKYLYLNEDEKYLNEKEIKAVIEKEEGLKKGSLSQCLYKAACYFSSGAYIGGNLTQYYNCTYAIECKDGIEYGYTFDGVSGELKKFQVIGINAAEEIALNDAKLGRNTIETIEHEFANGGTLYDITIKTKDNDFIYHISNNGEIIKKYKVISEEKILDTILNEVNLEQSKSEIKNENKKICDLFFSEYYTCSFTYLGNKYISYINAQDGTFIPSKELTDGYIDLDRYGKGLIGYENVITKKI